MNILRYALAMPMIAAWIPAWACSPPAHLDPFGFVRHHVGHLPKNALGVMFNLPSAKVRTGDFQVVSAQDKRPLIVRLRTIKNSLSVRLELVHGFQPGARYMFRYRPGRGEWKYPDEMTVVIDDASASTEGGYQFELAARPVHRLMVVPTSVGSCVAPAPAVVQEFTYAVPSSLAPYRAILEYAASTETKQPFVASKRPWIDSWANRPTLYDTGEFSLGMGFSKKYDTRKNAVLAPCGLKWPLVKLGGVVSFHEVDDLVHRLPAVEIDINKNIDGKCGELDALLQTVNQQSRESDLRELCGTQIASSFALDGVPLRSVGLEEWERQLSFFNSISATCNIVALAHLFQTERYFARPQTLEKLGAALGDGLSRAMMRDVEPAVHALVYLVDQLPLASRSTSARQLLMPAQPALVEVLAAGRVGQTDDIVRLIGLSGNLPPALREKVERIANGKNPAARQARAVLAGRQFR